MPGMMAAPSPPAPAAEAAQAAPPMPAPAAPAPRLEVAGEAPPQLAPDALARPAARADGWAAVRQFPLPTYEPGYDGPRTDFRETVLWKPDLRTGEGGEAEVSFFLSDAITSFRATAEGVSSGGQPGRAEAVVASRLPVSLAAKLPLEVTTGDLVDLPVTISNATSRPRLAQVDARFGAAFSPESPELSQKVQLAPGETRAIYYKLRVVGTGQAATPELAAAEGEISLSARSGSIKDGLRRVLKVVPQGYFSEQSRSGTLSSAQKITVDLPEQVPGSFRASLSVYASPTATLIAGTESIIREPTGCFEQASSANYPNVMVMRYLAEQAEKAQQNGAKAESPIAARTRATLDRGYKRLVGYESKGNGFEWFGADPGHEALTAYGLMQFADMARVYPDLDRTLVKRTAAWLRARRDGKGGYKRNARALDSFGRASDEVTNAYVTYALTETGEKDLAPEIAYLSKLALQTRDPYVLALAAGALANAASPDAPQALKRLAAMQSPSGNFPGARESITRSGGQSLEIETTSLATLALMKSPDHARPVEGALAWLTRQRSGSGGFGSTQATVLALKALTRAAEAPRPAAGGTVEVKVNGGAPISVAIGKPAGAAGAAGAADGPDDEAPAGLALLASSLHKGQNTIELLPSSPDVRAPYSLSFQYRTTRPSSSPLSPVSITVTGPQGAKMGDAVKVKAVIENRKHAGIPMVIARIGIPGGLTYQTWQLDELRDRKLVDFYETREREVIVYFRDMAPGAKRELELNLLAQVPGRYTAPPSQAYLYYTDEHRSFAQPLQIQVAR
jgi:alpha-2-macroglobulin-like protein